MTMITTTALMSKDPIFGELSAIPQSAMAGPYNSVFPTSTVLPTVIEAAPQSFLGGIWSWITLDMSHIAITLFIVALLVNLIRNEIRHESRIGLITSILAGSVAIFSVWLNFNVAIGVIFTAFSLWILTQSGRFRRVNEEEDAETAESAESISTQPEASVYSGLGSQVSLPTPTISTGLGFNLGNL